MSACLRVTGVLWIWLTACCKQVLQQVGQLVAQQVHKKIHNKLHATISKSYSKSHNLYRTNPQLIEVMESDT